MEEIAERTEEAVDSVLLGADDVTHSLYDVTYDVVIKTSTFIASYLIYLLIMCIVLDFWDKLKEPTKQFLRSKIEKYVDQRTLTEFFKQYTDRRTKGQDRDTPPDQLVVENKNRLILAETQSEAQIITEQQVDAPASEEWDSASQENYDDPVTAAEVSEVDDKETVVEKEDFDRLEVAEKEDEDQITAVEKEDEDQVGNLVDIEDDSQIIAAVEKEDDVQLLVEVDDKVIAEEREVDQIAAVVEKEDDVQALAEVDDQVTAVEGEDDQIAAIVEKEDDVQVLVEVDDQVTPVEKEDDQIAAVVEKEDDVQVLVEVDDQVTPVGGEDDQILAVVDDVQLLVDVDDQVTAVEKEDDQIAAVVEKEDDVQVLVEVDGQVTAMEKANKDQIAAVVEKEDVDHITAVVEKKYDVQEENLVDIEDDSQIAAVEGETGRGQDNCEDISGVIEEDNQLVSGDKYKPLSEAEVEIFVQDTISKAVQQYQSEEKSKDA